MTRRRWKAGLVALVVLAGVAAMARYLLTDPPPGEGGFAFVPSVPGERATIWAVGDGADGGSAARAVVDRIASDRVDRLLYLGDVYERGSAGDFRDNYATTYGRLAAVTAPTPGNHDWPRHADGYDPYWKRELGRTRTAAWYAFRAGGWTILSVASEAAHDRGSPQERWLRSQLQAPGTCRIAFWHRPRFSAGSHHGDQRDMAPVWDALRGRAAIVLTGHEHGMQRLHPIDGITSFVSGAGGHGHYGLRRDDPRLAFGDDVHDGALRLRLRPGAASYAFVSSAGRVLDSGTLRCRPVLSTGSRLSLDPPMIGDESLLPARSRVDRRRTRRVTPSKAADRRWAVDRRLGFAARIGGFRLSSGPERSAGRRGRSRRGAVGG